MSDGPIAATQVERFKRLAWPLLPAVLRIAQYLTSDAELAEDLTQETMIKAVRAIDSFRDGTNMKAWLLTILRRTHIDRLRVVRNRPAEISLDQSNTEPVAQIGPSAGVFDVQWDSPEDLMERFEDEVVIEALRALPDDIRWTLLLVDVEQLEQTEAAAALDVAVGTIKSRTHRGRGMLRDRLYERAIQRGWVKDTKERSA